MLLTLFDNTSAQIARPVQMDDSDLAELIATPDTFPSKAACPLLKLATFGDKRSTKNSLRWDGNVIEVTGAEGDYDGEAVPMTEAAAKLQAAGIRAILYTSARHTPSTPRWRVLLPFSKAYPPDDRARFLSRANGVLGGILADESWALSQTFFFGEVEGAEYQSTDVDGDFIDTRDDLDARAIGAPNPTKNEKGETAVDPHKIERLIHEVMSGANYHDALNRLASSYTRRGIPRDDVVAVLEAMMLSHKTDGDMNRWRERFDDIPRAVDSAIEKGFVPEAIPKAVKESMDEMQAAGDPLAWTGAFTVSDNEMEQIADPEWVYPNLLVRGHMAVFPAEPNGGKTTIFECVAAEISRDYRVIYVNADISGADAKQAQARAKAGGYELLLPDMKVGLSMADVVNRLQAMNEIGGDFSNVVMIFDTLKKMVDVINKTQAKELFKILRGLSAKGMTIAILAHTNKYNDADGKPIYEGTGDLRSDFDELIYFIPHKHDDKSMTVSTAPDKVRADFEPITFEISADRQVAPVGFVDVVKERRADKMRETDADDIEVINAFLSTGSKTQSDIVKHCGVEGMSRRKVLKLLKRYAQAPRAEWVKRTEKANNAAVYSRRLYQI